LGARQQWCAEAIYFIFFFLLDVELGSDSLQRSSRLLSPPPVFLHKKERIVFSSCAIARTLK
jgi:hypothetical protein